MGRSRRPLRAVLGHHDDGGGAVAHRTAVIELDRIGDQLRLPDDVEAQVGAKLGQGVLQTIRLVLDDYGRDLVSRRSVFGGMDAPGEAEQPREGQPGRPVGPVVHGAVERLRDLAARGVRHLLDAHHQGRIAQARGDRQHGVTEGNAAGGAGSLDLGAGYVLEPKLIGDDACQNLLPAQRSGDEVAEVQGAYLLALHASSS